MRIYNKNTHFAKKKEQGRISRLAPNSDIVFYF